MAEKAMKLEIELSEEMRRKLDEFQAEIKAANMNPEEIKGVPWRPAEGTHWTQHIGFTDEFEDQVKAEIRARCGGEPRERELAGILNGWGIEVDFERRLEVDDEVYIGPAGLTGFVTHVYWNVDCDTDGWHFCREVTIARRQRDEKTPDADG